MGRGIKYINPKTCLCGGKLKKVKNECSTWKCRICGKIVISAVFETLKKMSDIVHADPREVLNLDGPIVFGGGSKSGRRRKKKLKTRRFGQKPLDM